MTNEISWILLKNYLLNFVKIRFQKEPILKPLFVTYYSTLNCNFNCSYCGFAKSGETKKKYPNQLNTQDSLKLLEIVKEEIPYIYFTGGEPLLRADVVEVLKECKSMGFKSISVNTNMSLIHKKMEILDLLTNLVASYDMVDEERYSKLLGVSISTIRQVKKNIEKCAKLQKEKDFVMTVNCVVTETTIDDARQVKNFCFNNNIRFAIVPAELENGRINYKLKGNRAYKNLIKEIIVDKREGKPVFNTLGYLETIIDFKSFQCYPNTTPHIYPNGDLLYPCQPLLKIAINLLKAGSYKNALAEGIKKYGPPPKCRNKCHKSCYIEPPIFLKNPLIVIKEYFKSFK